MTPEQQQDLEYIATASDTSLRLKCAKGAEEHGDLQGGTMTGRTFKSGSYRDTDAGKPDYQGYMNPLVIEAYGKYMLKHQVQSNGDIRESDNWQGMFGENHKRVCMSSAFRHFMDWWKEDRGYASRDGLDEALGGLMFNLSAYWLKELQERLEEE